VTADDRTAVKHGLRDECEIRHEPGRRADRDDELRNLRIVEGRVVEAADLGGVGGSLRADRETRREARARLGDVGQPAAPAAASRSPSGGGVRCPTGVT
jgi:hypothetical protein